MKKVIVLICFFGCVLSGISQEMIVISPPVDTVPHPGAPAGCTVGNTEFFCGHRANDRNFNNTTNYCCMNNETKLYYTFVASQNITLTPSPYSGILFSIHTSSGTSGTPVSSSYILYGPFSQNDPYISLIENGLATPLSSDSPSASGHVISGTLVEDKVYVLEISASACWGYIDFSTASGDGPDTFLKCEDFEISCENCIPKFQPVDDRYVVSAWVKELEASTNGALNYENASLKVTSGANTQTFHATGQIIDGWQRIEGIIQTNSVGNLKMELIVDEGTAYFDDIRVSPFDGSMITYVYDPITLRLMAEMDERNYAKIYEYDEEGKLVRVKKETEKGIMTIQENRENSSTND
jgi:hypothetical protein